MTKWRERVAAEEGTTLNPFINVAVAEKLAALRTARYFEERASRAKPGAFDRLMRTAGDEPPRPGDEILAANAHQLPRDYLLGPNWLGQPRRAGKNPCMWCLKIINVHERRQY